MFYSLTGQIIHIEESALAIECHGVAFACAATAHTLRELKPGERATLYTHLNVREDALELFGFATRAELGCFRLLIAVTGVGPKAALALLSAFTPEQLGYFVAAGDAKSITRAQGVGPKLAQRLVLELKDKLPGFGHGPQAGNAPASAILPPDSEALAALLALGYQQAEALLALRGMDDAATTQEKIRHALKNLGGMG
ncbi:MAG: Holliday junction branch migration protein RuvA [Oscillospiraceae bacterium]|jgi:Holliday junction DNA helicase RuvA|nr:Holliday junction branch migration protein RuvA [Oscillospiraceae bacterium]